MLVHPLVLDPRLADIKNPASETLLSKRLWESLCSREAASAAEAFTNAELPAVAGLSGLLADQFPEEVADESFRKEAGWLLRRIMEHLGYEFCRKDVQINLPGIFTTGALYRRPGTQLRDRSVRINRSHRDAWAQARKQVA